MGMGWSGILSSAMEMVSTWSKGIGNVMNTTSDCFRPGMAYGCCSLRNFWGMDDHSGARRAAEKELLGVANIMPFRRPALASWAICSTAPGLKISYPYEKSNTIEFGPPRCETHLATLPTPPNKSMKMSPRLHQAAWGMACRPPRTDAGGFRIVGGSWPRFCSMSTARPRSLTDVLHIYIAM